MSELNLFKKQLKNISNYDKNDDYDIDMKLQSITKINVKEVIKRNIVIYKQEYYNEHNITNKDIYENIAYGETKVDTKEEDEIYINNVPCFVVVLQFVMLAVKYFGLLVPLSLRFVKKPDIVIVR